MGKTDKSLILASPHLQNYTLQEAMSKEKINNLKQKQAMNIVELIDYRLKNKTISGTHEIISSADCQVTLVHSPSSSPDGNNTTSHTSHLFALTSPFSLPINIFSRSSHFYVVQPQKQHEALPVSTYHENHIWNKESKVLNKETKKKDKKQKKPSDSVALALTV